jgi:2,3,4,5-tetrahydropyridine-2-carboxylate N-succinyltransferase
MEQRNAWGAGLATIHESGAVLDVWYPSPRLGEAPTPGGDREAAAIEQAAGGHDTPAPDPERQVRREWRITMSRLDEPPSDTADAYLRLHLLSHRLVQPNQLNLDGIFGVLNNVVWTSAGPCAVDGFEQTRAALVAAGRGPVTVLGVDKFPRMLDYVVPTGVRVANGAQVRLGAHLAPGTTVMHAGFVNYNAGTLGTSMVEGRISQGVVVEDGADIGGGASIMGTLSGGGKERVRIGARSLLGANAGVGIALGPDCVVEAGCYITAGAKVTLVGPWPDGDPALVPGSSVKARALSGRPGVLFRRNSLTGALEALPRRGNGIELNAQLHKN